MSKPFAPRVRVSTYISTWMPTRVGVAGYFAGGLSVGVKLTEINKFAFLSETSSNSSTNLTTGRTYAAGFANSGAAGYVAGGEDVSAANLSSIEKIAFPDDTQSVLSATLTTVMAGGAGMANSNVAGYIGGGYNAGGLNRIDKIAFSNDAKSTLAATLTSTRTNNAGFSNDGVAGYFGGGYDHTASTRVNGIDKIAFPADTKSTLAGTLTNAIEAPFGVADSTNAGYVGGGRTPTVQSGIDKIAFSSDTKSTLSATLTTARYLTRAVANSNVACYVGGGENSSGATIDTIEKITLPYDTLSVLSVTLSRKNLGMAPFSNQGTLNA